MFNYAIERILILEYSLLILLTLITGAFTILFEIRFQRREKLYKSQKNLLATFISQQVSGKKEFFSLYYKNFAMMIRVLQEFDMIYSDIFWIGLKKWIIYDIFYYDLKDHLESVKWHKQILALRALSLSPDPEFEQYAFKFLKSKNTLLQLTLIDYAISIENQKLLRACIKNMAYHDVKNLEFFYRDSFSYSAPNVFQNIFEIYKTCNADAEKLNCLKVFSSKIGKYRFEDLEKDLQSQNFQVRWWAMNALINCESEKTTHYFINQVQDPNWQMRFLAIHYLGLLLHEDLSPILEKALTDEHFWIRLSAAWSLKSLGEDGKKILLRQQQEDAKKVSQYVLLAVKSPNEKDMIKLTSLNLT